MDRKPFIDATATSIMNSHPSIPMAVDMSADRYTRQVMLPDFGEEGQEKLTRATVGVMGVGGLGSPAATYLAAAGVGRIILADFQVPDETNLNRQILHWQEDIGARSKTESAAWKLRRFNPDIEVSPRTLKVDGNNIAEVFDGADVILDCLDSFPPRYVLNEHCVRSRTPMVHAAVESWHGQVTTIMPGETPCLRCIFPRAPPVRGLFPIIGVTAGTFGNIEAAEAIKLLTGAGKTLRSKLLTGDLQYNEWQVVDIKKRGGCPDCGKV